MYGNVPRLGAERVGAKGGSDMLTIIEVNARPDGGHGLQSQSHRKECWLDGWVAVPPSLTEQVWACGGYCDLTLKQGVLTAVTPRERPQPEETADERSIHV